MDRRQDPRTIVTPYAFSVHPDLLGVPLATPWQRLGAIAIDGVVIIALSNLGGFTLAFGSSLLLFWLAFRGPGRNIIGKFFRIAAGCMGFTVASIAAIVFFAMSSEIIQRFLDTVDHEVTADIGGDNVDISGFLTAIPNLQALQETEDSHEAGALMTELAQVGRAAGLSPTEIRQALEGFIPDDAPWSEEGQSLVREAMASLRTDLTAETPDEGEVADQAPSITDPAARDSIESLNALIQDLDEERDYTETELQRAQARLEAEDDSGLLARLMNFLDEIGLGFGWGALYLTITHAIWKGTSIGKKLLRIRVVMIDLRPLNWWLSFERVGGYAAGLATGLLGFAQIFWDPNRQAIHDKVSETIVIQVGKKAVPGPWISEGTAQWERSRTQAMPPPPPPQDAPAADH